MFVLVPCIEGRPTEGTFSHLILSANSRRSFLSIFYTGHRDSELGSNLTKVTKPAKMRDISLTHASQAIVHLARSMWCGIRVLTRKQFDT